MALRRTTTDTITFEFGTKQQGRISSRTLLGMVAASPRLTIGVLDDGLIESRADRRFAN
jgi:hypothetical protein